MADDKQDEKNKQKTKADPQLPQKMLFQVAMKVVNHGATIEAAIAEVASEAEWEALFGVNRENERVNQQMKIFAAKFASNIVAIQTRLSEKYTK